MSGDFDAMKMMQAIQDELKQVQKSQDEIRQAVKAFDQTRKAIEEYTRLEKENHAALQAIAESSRTTTEIFEYLKQHDEALKSYRSVLPGSGKGG